MPLPTLAPIETLSPAYRIPDPKLSFLLPSPFALANLRYLCRFSGGKGCSMESEGGILSEVLIQINKETFPLAYGLSPGTVPTGTSLISTQIRFYKELFTGIT